jgi:hypothetical protein
MANNRHYIPSERLTMAFLAEDEEAMVDTLGPTRAVRLGGVGARVYGPGLLLHKSSRPLPPAEFTHVAVPYDADTGEIPQRVRDLLGPDLAMDELLQERFEPEEKPVYGMAVVHSTVFKNNPAPNPEDVYTELAPGNGTLHYAAGLVPSNTLLPFEHIRHGKVIVHFLPTSHYFEAVQLLRYTGLADTIHGVNVSGVNIVIPVEKGREYWFKNVLRADIDKTACFLRTFRSRSSQRVGAGLPTKFAKVCVRTTTEVINIHTKSRLSKSFEPTATAKKRGRDE